MTHRGRRRDAGVTLIEILVGLALIGILTGAVALTLAPRDSRTSVESEALRLAADLERAADHALMHQRGFGVALTREGYRLLEASPEGWVAHSAPQLSDVKLLARGLRIQSQSRNEEVYGVSQYLIPQNGQPWRVTLGSGAAARAVVFDGVSARISAQGAP